MTSADVLSRVPAAAIQSFMTDAFSACGLPASDAAITAGAMLDADLSGSDAHGIFRLPGYVRTLKRGHINVRPDIRVIEHGPATALVDGDNGMGHLVMTYVANKAVEMARETGLAWVGARRSNHAGAASTYAAIPLAARHGRHLQRGVRLQFHGALGRGRAAAGNQSDRGRHPGRQGGAGGARHRHLGRLQRLDPRLCARGQADAGGLGHRPQGRQADHRRTPVGGGHVRPGRRLQGQRAGAGAGPAGRSLEQGGVRARHQGRQYRSRPAKPIPGSS